MGGDVIESSEWVRKPKKCDANLKDYFKMRKKIYFVVGLSFTSLFLVSNSSAAERVETLDKNGDGKPDQWTQFKNDKRFRTEIDTDFDGKKDRWISYDAEGKTKTISKDTNHDGKPDSFQEMLKGRNLILKESDRNYDGKIDQRALQQWDANKRITTFMDGRPSTIPNPGYTWIWKEQDNDFDGKIDDYLERGNKNPSKEKIGQPI